MGNARWSDQDWTAHSRAASQKTRDQIFAQSGIHADMDPTKFAKREALDSPANPEATPIILGADETGSMGVLAEQIIKTGLGKIMGELYARKPVPDPQICCLALGDAYCDQAPIQATQFEASIVLAEQVQKMWLEGNGGGNGGESYGLAYAFAVGKTRCDSVKKARRKGYIFTIGDECCHRTVTKEQLARFLNLPAEADLDIATLLPTLKKDWNIFHLIVKPVTDQPVLASWRELLGERAIVVPDIEHLAEGIVAIIQFLERGGDVVSTFQGSEALATVKHVTGQLVRA